MTTTSLPPSRPGIRHHVVTWLGPDLGRVLVSDLDSIHVMNDNGSTLAFDSLDALDAVIEELAQVRAIASVQLAARTRVA